MIAPRGMYIRNADMDELAEILHTALGIGIFKNRNQLRR
jgi:hypothetical protein